MEGICYHLRWMLECQDKRLRHRKPSGSSAAAYQSNMSNTGRYNGQENRNGSAYQGHRSRGRGNAYRGGFRRCKNLEEVSKWIKAKEVYRPNLNHKAIYDKRYSVFKTLYKSNKDMCIIGVSPRKPAAFLCAFAKPARKCRKISLSPYSKISILLPSCFFTKLK